jgi:hypothetical protein
MMNGQTFLRRSLYWLGLFNSFSLLLLSLIAVGILNIPTVWPLGLFCLLILAFGLLQALLSALAHYRVRMKLKRGLELELIDRYVHFAAIVAWLMALLLLFGQGWLPTISNKIRHRDSRFLAQNFRDHKAAVVGLYEDLLRPSKGDAWRKKSGREFHWDGTSQVYKDGRVDIELFQELHGFNGQLFVGYTKVGRDALDGPIVEDLEKEYGNGPVVYQALGDDWYIWYED